MELPLAQARSARTAAYLGGRAAIRRELRSSLDLVPLVRAGLPFATLTAIARRLHLSVDALADALALSRRTLVRRKATGRLDANQSERLVRLANVAAWATDIFGDAGARQWLSEPNRALGGSSPLALLDTDVGAEAVRDVLGRIEYGVFG